MIDYILSSKKHEEENLNTLMRYVSAYYFSPFKIKEVYPFKVIEKSSLIHIDPLKRLAQEGHGFWTITLLRSSYGQLLNYINQIIDQFQNMCNQMSELEHVINYGCISFKLIPGQSTFIRVNNRPIIVTDEEFKYCIRKYGVWKVFKSQFKYNFYRRIRFVSWWVRNLFGGEDLYTKDEVTTAVFQACQILRQDLKPGEKLEDKIIQQMEKNLEEKQIPRQIQLESRLMLPDNILPIDQNFDKRKQELRRYIHKEVNNKERINRLKDF